MKTTHCPPLIRLFSISLAAYGCLLASGLRAAPWDPAATDYSGHQGKTLYVSKQGDNSDGGSWEKAFHTIQAALLAVPDDNGGHRIIIRPDTYTEANLCPAQKGAAGSYNVLIGDGDGQFGSGATGRVVIDSSDPQKGFKSAASWTTVRSSLAWDRWICRSLYAAGGDFTKQYVRYRGIKLKELLPTNSE